MFSSVIVFVVERFNVLFFKNAHATASDLSGDNTFVD